MHIQVIKENNPLSDELYDKIMEKAKEKPGLESRQWIHLADAVSRGTITPMEAYDSLALGYVPSFLITRYSVYMNTVF